MPEISLSITGSILLLLLGAIVATGLTFFFYKTTLPPVTTRLRVGMAIIRSLALTLLLMLLFEPLLRLIHRSDQPPTLAVLVDDSHSLTIADGGVERAVRLRSFVERNPFEGFSSAGRTKYFRFSSRLQPLLNASPDSLGFQGEVTDIGAALEQLKALQSTENIQAAVLLTDGNYTVGRNPLAAAEELALPLYMIGVGDTTQQRDLVVSRVTTNNIVYAETRVPVEVRIRSSGFTDEKVEVTLSEGTSILDRKVLPLTVGMLEYTVPLTYEPKEEGIHRYTVVVSSLPGEVTTKNNSATILVKVLKTKLRILIIAGAPSADVASVRQILVEEEHVSVRALVQKRAGEFYEGSLTSAVLDSADCFVLIGYPSVAATATHIQQIRDAIEQQKKPVLFIAAKTLDYGRAQVLEGVLPISWATSLTGEVQVFPHVAEKNRSHLLIELQGKITADLWHQLPPIFKTQTVVRAKPEADVLVSVKLQGIVLNEPLIVSRRVAGQKSLAISGYGLWRWRLLTQGSSQIEGFLPAFIPTVIRWLTTPEEGKRVRVVATKESFTSSEPVEFTGEVYDEQFQPIDDAELRLEVTSQGQRWEKLLRPIGSGRYEGGIEGLAVGEYSYVGRATRAGAEVGNDRGRFSVGPMNVEFLQTRQNSQLLEQIAYRTGGLYMPLNRTEHLIDSIVQREKFVSKEIVHVNEIDLWNWQYLAAAIIALLAIEWMLRKRNGML